MLSQIVLDQFSDFSLTILLLGFAGFSIGYLISQKQLNAALVKSKIIFEQAAVGIARLTIDGKFLQINQELCNIWGYTAEELYQLQFIDVTHPDDIESDLADLQLLLNKSIPNFSKEKRYLRKNGTRIWCQVTVSVIRDKVGRSESFLAVVIDISDRKRTEAALQESQERFRNLVETSSDWVWEVDENAVYTYASPKVRDLLGYEPQEILGKTPFELMPEAEACRVAEIFASFIEQLLPFQCLENTNSHKDGRLVTLETSGVPIFDVRGKFRGYRGIDRNITQRKQVEESLEQIEARNRAIISAIPDLMLRVRRDGLCLDYFFPKTADAGNFLPINQFLSEVLPSHLLQQQFSAIERALATGELQMYEHQLEKDNKIAYEEVRIAPLGEEEALILVRDISDRKQSEINLQESEEKYRRIVETAGEGIWILDRDHNTSFVNPQMAKMLGCTVAEMVGRSVFSFLDEKGQAIAELHFDRRRQGIQESYDFKFIRQDGSELWVIISGKPLFDREGNYAGTLGMMTDITERKQIEQALCESEQRLEGILASIQDVVWSTSVMTLEVLYMNRAAEKVFGRPVTEFNRDRLLWFKIVHPEDKKQVRQNIGSLFEAGSIEMEYRIVRPDGEIRWLYHRSRVAYDNAGQPIRVDGIDTDITERKQAEDRLEHNAFYDSLTDLPNRALFIDRLEHALTRSKRAPESIFAILFLDLDGFKLINDSLGHLTGDRLLQGFARRLHDCLRPSDTLARLGGDEFTILLEDIKNVKDAILVAERILQNLHLPFNLDGQQVFTNTSIGIALSTVNYQRADEILRDADTAMYRAKAQGKGCYAIFDPKMYHLALSRLQLETDLRRAINCQEFQVFYQPIVSLVTGKIAEFEALIRWQHPEKGLISPAEFIPIAEETGLIVPIGQWILKEACQQMQAWHQQFSQTIPLKISVNLSGKQIKASNFIEQIDKILAETGLDASCLKLEITESLLIENVEISSHLFLELRKRNIELCLDDFGTGYSSLSYLRRFPVNTIKIDRSFVKQLKPEDDSNEIVRAIITLAHILGMTAIAEGIETPEQLQQLQQLSCQKGQGYLFSKPLSKEDIEVLIIQNSKFKINDPTRKSRRN